MGRGYDDFRPRGHTTGSRFHQSSGGDRWGSDFGSSHGKTRRHSRDDWGPSPFAGRDDDDFFSRPFGRYSGRNSREDPFEYYSDPQTQSQSQGTSRVSRTVNGVTEVTETRTVNGQTVVETWIEGDGRQDNHNHHQTDPYWSPRSTRDRSALSESHSHQSQQPGFRHINAPQPHRSHR
jgi:hypothetical protein